MQVRYRTHLRLVRSGAMQAMIDGKEVLLRQFVRPLDKHALSAARFQGRPRNGRTIGPEACRLQVAMDLHLHGLGSTAGSKAA